MRILITGAGGAAAISVLKSLHDEHELYMADIDPCSTGLYLVPQNRRFIVPRGNDDQYVEKILSICKKEKIELVIPTVDVELIPLSININLFKENNILLPLSPAETLKICFDKYKLISFCKDKIPVPDTILLTENSTNAINKFPKFAKPRIGSGSNNTLVLHNDVELSTLPMDHSYLIQEMLPGDEYSVDVYISANNIALASVPRIRMKIDSGIAVAARTEHNPGLSELALQTAKLVGIKYVANIQFKRAQDQQFKLLEINPRFPGTLPLTVGAGIDIPKLLIQDLLGQDLPNQLLPFKEIMVVRYWTEHFCQIQEWDELCRKKEFGS